MLYRLAQATLVMLLFTHWGIGQQASESGGSKLTYEIRSQLVQIYLTVRDGGRRITDLDRSDFLIMEDGSPKEIHRLDAGELPLQIALLLDTSESMRNALAVTQEAAAFFVESLNPSDRVTLVTFNTEIRNTPQLTEDPAPILRAIRSTQARGGTKLYDALLSGMKHLSGKEGKKAIVAFSDGQDTARSASLELVLNAAAYFGYPIYTISAGAGEQGAKLRGVLRQISEINSGKSYPVADLHQLEMAFKEVTEDLRSAYVLNYYTEVQHDGRWHDVEIILSNPRYRVQCRKGFYARSGGGDAIYTDIDDPGPRKTFALPAGSRPDPIRVSRGARAASEEIRTLPIPDREIEPQALRVYTPDQAKPSQESKPVFKVETRFVEIPLLIESQTGEEIPALTKEDFRVYEDDSPQEIAFFNDEMAAGGIVELRDDAIRKVGLSDTVLPLSPAGNNPQELVLGRVYLVLDDLSGDLSMFLRVKGAAENMVRKHYNPLRPFTLHLTSRSNADISPVGDIVTLQEEIRRASPRPKPRVPSNQEVMSVYEAHLIERGDRKAVSLAELRLASKLGFAHENELGEVGGLEPPTPTRINTEVSNISHQMVSMHKAQVSRVLDGIRSVVGAAAADPAGYSKTIILLSPGFMMAPTELSPRLSPILNEANRHGIRFFTVDASGLAYRPPMSSGSDVGFLMENPQLGSILFLHENSWRYEKQNVLHRLAKGTGGRFLHSSNDLAGAAGSALRTTGSFYYLGYVSKQPSDGRYHRIRVTSSVRETHIYARKGYYAIQRSSPVTLAEKSTEGEDWRILLERAEAAAVSGDVAVLAPTLEQLVRRFPNDANLWYTLGVANLKQGNNARAIETLQRGFGLSPSNKDVGIALARAFLAGGYQEAAAETMEAVIQKHPADTQLLINLGRIYEASSRTAEAYQVYRRLLDHRPGLMGDAYLALARTSLGLGREIEASLFIEDFLAQDGDREAVRPWIEMLNPDLRHRLTRKSRSGSKNSQPF